MRRIDQAKLIASEEVVQSPVARACHDQSFELPTGIYVAMALMFAGFVTVLAFAFHGSMAVSYGVIFTFLTAFFAVPAIFPRMAREPRSQPLQWNQFLSRGIDTATGHSSAASATVLVLALPFLILCFGIAIATINALV